MDIKYMKKVRELKRSLVYFMTMTGIVSLLLTAYTEIPVSLVQASAGGYPDKQEFDDVSGRNHYNYCPSYIQTDEDTRYIFYCRNPKSGVIVDSIFWRKAVRNGDEWIWGPQYEALAKGTGWESVHVCDPEVRKGEFDFNGHVYGWVMVYLGCDQLDNNHNQTGVAFADSIEGPWVKWSGNPLIGFPGTGYWGTGQPSATSVDGKGQLLLFYTKGDAAGARVIRRHVDLSDMAAPDLGEEKILFKDGLTGKDGSFAVFHNAGFAYDSGSDRFYVVRERHPYESLECNFISSEIEVAYTDGANVWNNSGVWKQDGLVNPDNTGKYRNHNPGLLTDPFGNLTGGKDDYTVVYSVSDPGQDYLWSYRIHSISNKYLSRKSKIDDRNTAVRYSGNWDHSEDEDERFYLNTSKWSSQAGAKANLSFRGGTIEIWGTKSPDHGKFKVILNGSLIDTVDAYSKTTTGPVLLYRAEHLLTGFNGLTVELSGTKDPSSGGYKVDIDYFVVDVSASSYATPTVQMSSSSDVPDSLISSDHAVSEEEPSSKPAEDHSSESAEDSDEESGEDPDKNSVEYSDNGSAENPDEKVIDDNKNRSLFIIAVVAAALAVAAGAVSLMVRRSGRMVK